MDIQNLFVMGLSLAFSVAVAVILWHRWQLSLMLGDQIRVKAGHRAEMIESFKHAVIDPLLVLLGDNDEVSLLELDGVWAIVQRLDGSTLIKISFAYREVHDCEDDELVCNLETPWRQTRSTYYRLNELRLVLRTCMSAIQVTPSVEDVKSTGFTGTCGEYVRSRRDVRNLSLVVKQYSEIPN